MDAVELLMNVTPNKTRIALVETGMLREVHIERQANEELSEIFIKVVSLSVTRMQSAFVDIVWKKRLFYTPRILYLHRM